MLVTPPLRRRARSITASAPPIRNRARSSLFEPARCAAPSRPSCSLLALVLPAAAGARERVGSPACGRRSTSATPTDAPERDRHPRLDAGPGPPRRAVHALPGPVPATPTAGGRLDESGADSGWRNVGRRPARELESGWTFTFQPPSRRRRAHAARRRVVRVAPRHARGPARAREVTEAGHRSDRRRRPAGFSAATCRDQRSRRRTGAGRS